MATKDHQHSGGRAEKDSGGAEKNFGSVEKDFADAVNMTAVQLERWLATEESASVGWTHEGEAEAVGHQAGRRILELKRRHRADLNDDDRAFMRKVATSIGISPKAAPPTMPSTRAGVIRS